MGDCNVSELPPMPFGASIPLVIFCRWQPRSRWGTPTGCQGWVLYAQQERGNAGRKHVTSGNRKNTCTIHAQYMHNTCTIHAQYMHNTCTIHAQYMHNTWTIHAQYMDNTWTIHGQYMDNTWTIHGQYMDNTWTIHAQYMHNTCTIHAQYLEKCIRSKETTMQSIYKTLTRADKGGPTTLRHPVPLHHWP